MPEIKLKKIPEDVHEHLIKIQSAIKIKKKTAQYSLENTVYNIVREHKTFIEKSIPSSARKHQVD